MKFGITLSLFLASWFAANAEITVLEGEPAHKERGEVLMKEILAQEWTAEWKGSTLEDVELVRQSDKLTEPTGLAPVWSGKIQGPDGKVGHLIWDTLGEGKLVEFSLDSELKIRGENVDLITGVPGLQEFPMKDSEGRLVASGCVPTAGASVVAYWADRKFPQWRGETGKTNTDLAKRLRGRLKMTLYPDVEGFSENGMALSGAFPNDLVTALREDAEEHGVPIECGIEKFSVAALKEEIAAKRPVLLSCVVRVAHKPELSWGHEVAAVGWTKLDGFEMVGVLDNFYPTKYPEAIRWIRWHSFGSLITVKPGPEAAE